MRFGNSVKYCPLFAIGTLLACAPTVLAIKDTPAVNLFHLKAGQTVNSSTVTTDQHHRRELAHVDRVTSSATMPAASDSPIWPDQLLTLARRGSGDSTKRASKITNLTSSRTTSSTKQAQTSGSSWTDNKELVRKVIIVVSVIVGVLLLVMSVWIALCIRRRNKKKAGKGKGKQRDDEDAELEDGQDDPEAQNMMYPFAQPAGGGALPAGGGPMMGSLAQPGPNAFLMR